MCGDGIRGRGGGELDEEDGGGGGGLVKQNA